MVVSFSGIPGFDSIKSICFSDYKGPSVDPYTINCGLIRNQTHFVDLPEEVNHVKEYNGKIKVTLANGDSFSGIFENGEREGYGVLKLGLINKRKLEMVEIEGHYDSEFIDLNFSSK